MFPGLAEQVHAAASKAKAQRIFRAKEALAWASGIHSNSLPRSVSQGRSLRLAWGQGDHRDPGSDKMQNHTN